MKQDQTGLMLASADPIEQTRLARENEPEGLRLPPFLPLGGFRRTAAWRDTITGLLERPRVVFWNVMKA